MANLIQEINQIILICDEFPWDWEIKFDIIFKKYSKFVRPLLDEAGIHFDYYDPDTSYEEDVRALVNALKELKERLGGVSP